MLNKIKKDKYAILPFNTEKIKEHYLVSNYLGGWGLLNEAEFKQLHQNNRIGDNLKEKLSRLGLAINKDNTAKLISEYRRLNSHLFSGTSLHIVVVTARCNLRCNYCQTDNNPKMDMDIKTAKKIVKFLIDCPNPFMTLEFQGGEPLLNWKVVKFLTLQAKKINKNIRISLVTNGILLNLEKIKFLISNNVNICISLDGPEKVHDKNRIFPKGQGSYTQVSRAIRNLKSYYKKNKIEKSISLLPTITKQSLKKSKQIIDEYVKCGSNIISLRPVTEIGLAQLSWDKLGYTPDEFNVFWRKSMDYIMRLNKKGIKIKERMAHVLLRKILIKSDPGYVDLMCPCGAGRKVLTYTPSGDIYPCDEARMTGEAMFNLGNLHQGISYEQIMKNPNLFSLSCASLMQLWDYNTAFFPWLGTCPVMNYVRDKNLIPKITTTPMYKISRFQVRYLFTKMLESKENEKIFWGWVGKDKPDFSVHD